MRIPNLFATAGSFLASLFVLATAPAALAHTSETINSISVSNYTGYVIASDADIAAEEYDRDAIIAETQVQYSTTSGTQQTFAYRLDFRLLDSADNPVTIRNENGAEDTIYSVFESGVTLPFTVFNVTVNSSTRTYSAPLMPVDVLDHFDQYHVEVKLYQRSNIIIGPLDEETSPKSANGFIGTYSFTGDEATTTPQTFYHFTSVVSNDPELNVIATLDSASYSRTYLVETVPGKDAFEVDTSFTLRRYDGFSSGLASGNITVRLNLELRNADTDELIPLDDDQVEFTKSVLNHGLALLGNPIPPASPSFNESIQLRPSVQLDSVNNLYKVAVAIEHVEVPGDPAVAGNEIQLADQRLLHFNGTLLFGDIETQFTSIANTPTAFFILPDAVRTSLAVDGNSGSVVGSPGYTYGDGTALVSELEADGTARYVGGTPVTLNGPADGVVGNVRFSRNNLVLDSDGALANLTVILPTGFGYRNDLNSRILKSTLQWSNQRLNQMLRPQMAELVLLTLAGSPFYICEETKPLWIECATVRWFTAEGRFQFSPTSSEAIYVRKQELAELEAAPVLQPSMRMKRSNEQVFRSAGEITSSFVTVVADDNTATVGSALMSVDIKFNSGKFTNHFPYNAEVTWAGDGEMTVVEDNIDPDKSRLLVADPVDVDYSRDCFEPDCGLGKGLDVLSLNPDDQTLTFTPDGGLAASGDIVVPRELTWGWINEPEILDYAQKVDAFADGAFHMPGSFLRGDQASVVLLKPAVLLFTGVGNGDPSVVERSGTAAYQDGFGDYGGLNFRVGADGAKEAESVLAGEPTGKYPLRARAKYYLRRGGVSGIHEAVFGAFPSTAVLYGYDFKFTNYGLAYLDSQNVDSRTEGSVTIDYPSDFEQNFEELKFSCLGALEDAKVPSDEAGLFKELNFWKADFSVLAILFDRKDGAVCDPGEGFLTLGVEAYAQHVDSKLYGTLGFRPNGNLITLADNLLDPPFDSRLKLPNNFKLDGPGDEEYNVTPVNDAYYNNWDFYQEEPGFINIAAKMDVPFFEDLKIHMQTSADKDGTTAPVYLMGGWPNKGFEITPGSNFFNENPSDKDNRGFPTDTSVAGYRAGDTDGNQKYLVRAQRNWLGVVDLDYPLDWSTSTRAFTAFEPVHNDLLVINVEHQAKYLSAENAELTFGIQYDGIPQVNIANLAFDQLTGTAAAVENAIGSVGREAIDAGMKRMEDMLSDQLDALFDEALDDLIDPVIDNLYNQLQADFDPVTKQFTAGNPGNLISSLVTGGGNSVKNRINQLIDGAGAGQIDLIHQLDANLEDVQQAVQQIIDIIDEAPDGSRMIVSNLIEELIGELAAQFLGSIVDSQLNALIAEADPSLDKVQEILEQLNDTVGQIRDQLQVGSEFANELKDKLTALNATVNTVATQVQNDVVNLFNGFDYSIDNPFTAYSAADLKAMIRQKFENRFFGSTIASGMHEIVKQRLYDIDAAIREGVDSVFQQVNLVIRDLLNETLAEVDNAINGMLGDVNSVMGAGKVNGYAHINGDSLKLLRLDIYARLGVPSEMEFNAYLQIKELDSEGTPTECLPASGKATEVTFGAVDVAVEWISPDLTATVEGKFTFDSGVTPPQLVTMGAGFELTGELSFETFKIKYLGASMAFGALENYFSCAARVQVNSYEGMGGLMFGKTCTLDPFFWDPDVQSILGTPPFTGAYVYAEVWIPISEALLGIPATCLFQVSAGVGAGAGFFIEGPTFVGKMLLGASGDLLCIVSVSGEVKLVGVKNADGLNLKGSGRLEGEIGPCPFCISFGKTVGIQYKNNNWDVDF